MENELEEHSAYGSIIVKHKQRYTALDVHKVCETPDTLYFVL